MGYGSQQTRVEGQVVSGGNRVFRTYLHCLVGTILFCSIRSIKSTANLGTKMTDLFFFEPLGTGTK